jgi:hypothetical protein
LSKQLNVETKSLIINITHQEVTKMQKHGVHNLRDRYVSCSTFQQSGKFGRLFPGLPAHEPNPRDLVALGVKGGPMDEGQSDPRPDSRTIPAGFTFLGQLIDHDITFDPTSSLERQNDPSAIRNFRTPLLELDCVYGSGPGASPYLYDQTDPDKLLTGTLENPADLPRNSQKTALIGDPRNDENLIVSQLQLAFLKLHNAVVDYLRAQGVASAQVFKEAQRLVRWHYQWVVVHEFLPLTIGQFLVDEILRDGPSYYQPGPRPFMPVEFSVAAYRFGHSQVRAAYKVNEAITQELFDLPFFAPIQPHQVIDWTNFFHITSSNPPQFSRQIDAKLSRTLLDLQPPIVSADAPAERRSLAVRNLMRGASFDLPSGQTVAKAMGLTPLSDEELGLATWDGFKEAAPLWFYILKEAEVQTGGETLGQVGGRIVGEVLIGLLQADPMSYFNLEPRWQPNQDIAPEGRMVDLLKFAGVGPASKPTTTSESTPSAVTNNNLADLEILVNTELAASKIESAPAQMDPKPLAGQPRLRDLEIVPADADTPPKFLRDGRPFDVRLTLDLTETEVPDNTPLTYAKPLNNGGPRLIISQARDTFTPADTFVINMSGQALSSGLYRLEASVTLKVLPNGPDLTTHPEGTLVQVY